MVLQRVQARVAGDELTAPYDEPLPAVPEAAPESDTAPGWSSRPPVACSLS
jgi:hypothetical protein